MFKRVTVHRERDNERETFIFILLTSNWHSGAKVVLDEYKCECNGITIAQWARGLTTYNTISKDEIAIPEDIKLYAYAGMIEQIEVE